MTWLLAVVLVLSTPSNHRTIVTSTSIEVYEPISFAPGSDRVPAKADRMLAAIAAMLDANPSLLVVAVEADVSPADSPDASARRALGMRRASAVRAKLIALGVAPFRLLARTSEAATSTVELIVVERAGDADPSHQ